MKPHAPAPAFGVGVVLAGGRSTRFGAEKAIARIDGAPMLLRVVHVLGAGCVRVAINAPAGSGAARLAAEMNAPHLTDPPGGPTGPLAGVLAGLDWARGQDAAWLATAPCDTPNLPHDLVARLLAGLATNTAAQVATASTAHGLQPLCTVWKVSSRARVVQSLLHGVHPPVRSLFAALEAVEIPFAGDAAFANVNTPHDLAALAR